MYWTGLDWIELCASPAKSNTGKEPTSRLAAPWRLGDNIPGATQDSNVRKHVVEKRDRFSVTLAKVSLLFLILNVFTRRGVLTAG